MALISLTLRYCGKEVTQHEDFSITVTCKDTTMKTEPVRIQPGRKSTDSLNEGEKTQLLSVVGSLNWIARQCRPDISYRVSRLRSRVTIGTIADLKEANKVLAYAVSTADQGLDIQVGST